MDYYNKYLKYKLKYLKYKKNILRGGTPTSIRGTIPATQEIPGTVSEKNNDLFLQKFEPTSCIRPPPPPPLSAQILNTSADNKCTIFKTDVQILENDLMINCNCCNEILNILITEGEPIKSLIPAITNVDDCIQIINAVETYKNINALRNAARTRDNINALRNAARTHDNNDTLRDTARTEMKSITVMKQ
jgi:hypothetical protein